MTSFECFWERPIDLLELDYIEQFTQEIRRLSERMVERTGLYAKE